MKILAIETSGPTFGLAVAEGKQLISEIFLHESINHSERIIAAIDKIIKSAKWRLNNLDKIAVSVGPGSFTGIRIGLSCARTLSQNLNIPLVGINSLDIISKGVQVNGLKIYSLIDAQRNEVFTKDEKNSVVIEPVNKIIAELNKEKRDSIVAGSATISYSNDFSKINKNNIVFANRDLCYPKASFLALIAADLKGSNYRKVKPLYVRRSWAEEKNKN